MKIIKEIEAINATMEERTKTFLVQFNEKEQEKIDSLEFYINFLENPDNFTYSDKEAQYSDFCIYHEYKTVSNLICDIFGNYTKIFECLTTMPGGYSVLVYGEKALFNNLAFVHVTESLNI
jgi:hypothetical protein